MTSNLITLISARLVSPAVSFLIVVMVARSWGVELLGQYSTVVVWLVIFQHVSTLGISEYISREVGSQRAKAGDYFSHSLLIVLFSSVACMLIMAAGALWFDYPREVKYGILIATVILPLNACVNTSHAVFAAFQRIGLIAVSSVAESVLFFILGGAVILMGHGLIPLICCLVAARSGAVALNLALAGKVIAPFRFRFDRKLLRAMLPPVVAFGVTGIAFHVFMRADVILISMLKDMDTVGAYTSASKLIEVCMMLPLAFYFLNLPIAADAYRNSNSAACRKIESGARLYLVLVICVFAVIAFFNESILGMIYGKPFPGASVALRILIVAYLIHSAEIVLEMSCQAAGYQKTAMFIALSRAAVNILLNLVFIPRWGAVGAALATLASIVLSFSSFLVHAKKYLRNTRLFYLVEFAKSGN